jgi:tripartite-type tricarboxylate transporter receptor subunit TctC
MKAIATSKSRPLNFGTIGVGSYPEVFLGWLNGFWGVDITGVPYSGGGPVGIALLGGEVQVSAAALGNFIGQIQGGQLRALAVSSAKRSRLLPDVPTYAEAGLGTFQGHLWWGLFAPTGTSARIVGRLNNEFGQLFREPRFVEFLESQAAEPAVGTSEAFATFVKADQEWTAGLLRSLKRAVR